MSAAFVNQLRARGDVVRMASAGATTITVRVEVPEVWDVVRIAASPDDSVRALKERTLAILFPQGDGPECFVMKLRGFEVLEESMSLAAVGAVDGSIFLLTHRNRRPVR